MKKVDDSLSNIWQDGKAACFEFETMSNVSIHSGQFLMVRGTEDILPVPVYPIGVKNRDVYQHEFRRQSLESGRPAFHQRSAWQWF